MRPSASSFPLQLCLIASIFYAPIWVIVTLALMIFKGVTLPYPPSAFWPEVVSIALVWLVQYGAVTLGKRGNLTENTSGLGVALLLLLLAECAFVYFMWFQVYVLMLDLAVSATFVIINGLNVILTVAAVRGIGQANAMQGGVLLASGDSRRLKAE